LSQGTEEATLAGLLRSAADINGGACSNAAQAVSLIADSEPFLVKLAQAAYGNALPQGLLPELDQLMAHLRDPIAVGAKALSHAKESGCSVRL
jgi:hypothetical protein